MKRKLVVLFGLTMLLGCLVACGGDDGSSADRSSTARESVEGKSDAFVPESKAQVDENVWQTKPMEMPDLNVLTWEDVNIADVLTTPIAATPFDYTSQELWDMVSGYSYIKDNFELYRETKTTGWGNHYKQGDFVHYLVEERIYGMEKEDADAGNISSIYAGFQVTTTQDTSDFSDWNSVYIHFADLESTKETQELIYPIVEDILGKEFAEYLVYHEQGEDFSETVEEGNVEYTFYSRRSGSGIGYQVSMKVNHTREENKFYYYDNGYEAMTDNMKYNLSQVTGGRMDDFDVLNFGNYEADYLAIAPMDYEYTDLDSVSYSVVPISTTQTEYKYSMKLYAKNEDGNGNCYVVNWDIIENAGEMERFHVDHKVWNNFNYNIKPYHDEDIFGFKLAQIKHWFPDADLSSITYEELDEKEEMTIDLPSVTIMDKECSCKLWMDEYTEWSVALDWTK